MTPEDLIKEIHQEAGEWLEMVEDPTNMIVRILAYKVILLKDHINYLEKRIDYANTRDTTVF